MPKLKWGWNIWRQLSILPNDISSFIISYVVFSSSIHVCVVGQFSYASEMILRLVVADGIFRGRPFARYSADFAFHASKQPSLMRTHIHTTTPHPT